MTVMPGSSDRDRDGSGAGYWGALGGVGRALAAASVNVRAISSGVAPGCGGSGSIPTSSAARVGACGMGIVAEVLGTVEHADNARRRARSAAQRPERLTTTAPDGASRRDAAGAGSW